MAAYIQRARNASLPREQQQQQYAAYPAPSQPWQPKQQPSTPPPALPSNGKMYSPAATRSPQMIKCSDCACLVPLLELGEHTCRGASASSQQMPLDQRYRQRSAEGQLGSGFQQQERPRGQLRMVPGPLKVNVTHGQMGQLSPSLPSPYHIPLPRTPASLSPSPANSPSNLSPSYLDHSREPSASGSDNGSYSYMSQSPSARSDLSASNNAGIGARANAGHMPFFEKYQRVYGASTGSGSISSNGSGDTQPTAASSLSPRTPVTPGWNNQTKHDARLDMRGQLNSAQPAQTPIEVHRRDQSESSKTDSLSASTSDHLHNYLDTPDTSPDFPTSPAFPEPEEANEKPDERNIEGQEEDDILDSYPTPQPTFSGQFGALVIDDQYQGSEPARPDTQITRSFSRGLPMSHSTPDSLARLAAGEDAERDRSIGHSKSLNQRRRSRTNGWNPSSATPKMLASASTTPRLGGAFTRSGHSSAQPDVAAGSSPGLGLDACLDDLLKEMNRESVDAAASPSLRIPVPGPSVASRSPSPSSASSSRSVAQEQQRPYQSQDPIQPPIHCDSCVTPIASSRKPIRKDGQTFCKDCYIELYLPKCRKCTKPIEGKAIGSGDGKVKGKFHPACFSCFECSAPFPTGDFYVYEQRPYCGQHYHALNGTLCANNACTQIGIEGPCVSLAAEDGGSGGRYHPSCFICSHPACSIALDQYHYVLSGLPYCESHAHELEDYPQSSGNTPIDVSSDSVPVQAERRRSRSLDTPTHINASITALRKKAGSPSYFNRNATGGSLRGNAAAIRQNGPPSASGYRRAEKRRTVIQDVTRL